MEYTLSMTFLAETGEKVTMSITGVNEELNQEQASTLMDTIIERDIFITKNGPLTGKYSAELIKRQVDKFEVA